MLLALLIACLGTSATNAPPQAASNTTVDTASDASGSSDSAHADTADGLPLPYCRSLDPSWSDRYIDPLDRALADLIARHGLLGDPALSVDATGTCVRRDTPAVSAPLAQLGRALFFSRDLSGDRDVACATCHHPLLGGGDALSVSVGPTDDPDAMGADRVRGLTDVSALHLARNAQTTFNVAFWDRGLFWDSRVEALDPEGRAGGAGSPMSTPDSTAYGMPAPTAGQDLADAQAWFPVTEAHEMAGSWATRYTDREVLRAALAARMATDPAWIARFDAACADPALPEDWAAACALPAGAARDSALLTFPHVGAALGAYERSQVFTDTPWRAYVQGDTTALSDGAKQGALLFLQSVADGGQNCVACHRGDFFTDELFHAVGSPQIGPGKTDGEDLGRAYVTDDPATSFRFRTPTLLNVEVSAPYFHSGAYATLEQAIGHYDNPNGRLLQYFGDGNKSDLNVRPWCAMTEFASLPDCAELYTIDHTHRGRVANYLDPELSGIKTLENNATVFLAAFLRSLTDPRVTDADALSPWIDPTSTLAVTATSSEWATMCDTTIERAADMNLHNKGLRWLATGAMVDGADVNTRGSIADVFGVHYWELFDTAFTANTGVNQDARELAIATLAVLDADQRQVLYDAYAAMTARGNHARILALRQEVFEAMNARRDGVAVPDDDLRGPILQASRLEAQDITSIVQAYREVAERLTPSTRTAQLATLRAVARGDLSALPTGVYTPGNDRLTQDDATRRAVRDATAGGTLPWDDFAAGFTTWSTGWECRNAFMGRMLDDDRRANYYGFSVWAAENLFDLEDGSAGSGDFELTLSEYLAGKDAAYGLEDLFDRTLDATIAERQAYDAARLDLVRATAEAGVATGTALDAARARIATASERVGEADAAMLLAEMEYYLALGRAEEAAASTDLADYVACIEDPATQAMRGHGGFAALGGGSCEP
jgi:cytochrome c peroxidase